MPIRRMALAGMMAAFGAGAWYMAEHGPQKVANAADHVKREVTETASAVKLTTAKAVIAKKGLAPEDQEALLGRAKAQYPQLAKKLEGWTPVTATKLEALNEAYQGLSAAERRAIARNVSQWQAQVWQKYPTIQTAWNAGGVTRERNVAQSALELSAAEREALDTSVTGLWSRISAEHPQWAATVESIMSAK